jgi:hypothetical protein
MPDVTGTYAVRGAAFLHHDAECDASVAAALGLADPHTEVLAEVMDPEGTTIAYFADRALAERFCAWMNHLLTPAQAAALERLVARDMAALCHERGAGKAGRLIRPVQE